MTTLAPRARRLRAARARVLASGRNSSPATLAGRAECGVAAVTAPTRPILTPAAVMIVEGLKLGHATGLPLFFSTPFAPKKGKWGPGGASLEGASRIVTGFHRRGRGPLRPEVELVIADGGSAVAEGIVGSHDRRTLGQVRFEGALKHVARVEQDDRTTPVFPNLAQVFQVAPEPRQGGDVPVQVACAHYRDGDLRRRRRVREGGEGDQSEKGREGVHGQRSMACVQRGGSGFSTTENTEDTEAGEDGVSRSWIRTLLPFRPLCPLWFPSSAG